MVENMRGKLDKTQDRPVANGLFRWEKLLAIIILMAAFFLYTHNLSAEGLWRDEGLGYARVMQPVLQILKNQNIVQGNITPDLHPPGYFLMLKAVVFLSGNSEFVLRLPSVFAAVLSVAMLGRLSADLDLKKHRFAPLIAMLVIGSSPFVYWYAREARMYSWLIFGVALFYWQLSQLLKKHHSSQILRFTADWLPPILAALLLLATHISAVFVIAYAILGLFLFVSGQRWQIPLIALAASSLGLTLISLTEWGNNLLIIPFDFFATRPYGQLLYETTTTFNLGGAAPPETVGPVFLIFIILALIGTLTPILSERFSLKLFLQGKAVRTMWVSFFAIFIPLLLFYLVSLIKPGYSNPRHLTILAVPWFLLITMGIVVLFNRSKWLGLMFCVAVVWVGGRTIVEHNVRPPIVKDQLREIHSFLEEHYLPDDTLLFHLPALTTSWQYYDIQNLRTIGYPRWTAPLDSEIELETFQREIASSGRIWFVDSLGRDSNIESWLDENWQSQHKVNFKGSWTSMSVTLYLPPEPPIANAENRLIDQPLVVGNYEFSQLFDLAPAMSGDPYWVTALWTNSAANENVCLKLETNNGDLITQDCHRPKPIPAGTNTIGFALNLPQGLQTTHYQLRLSTAEATSDPLPVTILRSHLPVSDAVFEDDGFLVFEPELTGEVFYPGSWIHFNAIWQLAPTFKTSTAERNRDTHWRLVNWRGQTVSDKSETVTISTADSGQPLLFLLPPDATGRYRLQLKTESGRWKTVSKIKVTQWPFEDQLPSQASPTADENRFTDELSLVGYALNRQNEQLDITLFWQADQRPTDDWIVFIHVTEPGQPPAAQTANKPAAATRPTAGWRAGEIIQDSHTLTLPEALTAAQSNIYVGLYLASDPNIRASLTVNGEPQNDRLFFIEVVPSK